MSVEVIQADRDAAADVLDQHYMGEWKTDGIRRGEADNGEHVQAFAAHRHQAEEAMRERCAEIAERYPSNESYVVPIVRGVATAIRSIDTRGE